MKAGWMDKDLNNPLNAETGKLPPLEGLFHALAHEGRSVLMVSDDEALLDTCGQSVVRKLRQTAGIEVSAMFDMDREVLLQRFNRLIENFSVDQALQSGDVPRTQQVWLQHIHNSQELDQAKLLIRLSSDFPAAGVKLLLMANNVCADDLIHHGQAKKLLVWHAPVTKKPRAASPTVTPKPLAGAAMAAPHWMDEAAAEPPVDFVFSNPKPAARSPGAGHGQRWVVQLLLGVFVLVCVAVLGLHQWQASQVAPSQDSAESPVVKPEQGVITPETTAPVEPLPVATDTAVPVTSENPSPDVPKAVEVDTPAEPPAVATAVSVPTSSPAPAPAPAEGVQWAAELKAGAWVVQHVALDTLPELRAWQAQHKALANAQAVALRRPNGDRYWVLVSGPFTSLDRANAFARSPGVPNNHWSRGVASLQASLDKTTAAR
jgi:hypothetical protein